MQMLVAGAHGDDVCAGELQLQELQMLERRAGAQSRGLALATAQAMNDLACWNDNVGRLRARAAVLCAAAASPRHSFVT